MAGGLRGWRVAVTRAAEPDERLAELVRAAGGEPVVAPLIRVIEPADPAPLRAAAEAVDAYDWIVFTSARAVTALTGAAGGAWPRAGRVRAAAVGPATARAAALAGFGVHAIPDEYTAEWVTAAMIEAGLRAGERVLWPRAAGARDVLARHLQMAGANLDQVEAYRTIGDVEGGAALAARVHAGEIDVLTFASPSAVNAYAAGAALARTSPLAADVRVAVIGPVTARAARQAGLRVDVEPAQHTLDAMIAALVDARGGGSATGEAAQ